MYKQLYCNCFSISFFHIAVLPIWTQFVEVEFTAPVEVWHAGWILHAVREQLPKNCTPFPVHENGNGGSIHFFQNTRHVLC